MKLQLNREYATRHLGVALLFTVLCGWFAWDGAIAWPNEIAAWEKENGTKASVYLAAHPEYAHSHTKEERGGLPHLPSELDRQFQFAGLCGVAALIIAGLVLLDYRRTLTWDDEQMCGTLTGGTPLRFDDIAGFDESKWEKKGILTVYAKDARKVVLDTWHHTGARELAEKLLAARPATN